MVSGITIKSPELRRLCESARINAKVAFKVKVARYEAMLVENERKACESFFGRLFRQKPRSIEALVSHDEEICWGVTEKHWARVVLEEKIELIERLLRLCDLADEIFVSGSDAAKLKLKR